MPFTTDQFVQIISGSTGIRQITPNFRSKRDRKEIRSLVVKNRRERLDKPDDEKNNREELDTYV